MVFLYVRRFRVVRHYENASIDSANNSVKTVRTNYCFDLTGFPPHKVRGCTNSYCAHTKFSARVHVKL